MNESADALVNKLRELFENASPALQSAIDSFVSSFEAQHSFVLSMLIADSPELATLVTKEGHFNIDDAARAVRTHPKTKEMYAKFWDFLWQTTRDSSRESLQKVLLEKILIPLGHPLPIRTDELTAAAERRLFSNLDANQWEIDDLEQDILRQFRRYRSNYRILVATAEHPFELGSADEPIWKNDWAEIRLEAVPSATRTHVEDFKLPDRLSYVKIFASFHSWASKGAMRVAVKETRRAMRGAMWAINDFAAAVPGKTHLPKVPSINRCQFDEHNSFIRLFMSSCFLPPRVKDRAVARRRNCVQLIVHAGRQDHDALALSLYCSAMEAVLSRGRDAVSKSLAEDAAVLLEPVPTLRLAAVKFIRDIYNLRSRVLHGDSLDQDPSARATARKLAIHVLQAVWNWEQKALSTNASQSDPHARLLVELESARITGASVGGQWSGTVRKLWETQ